jgi:hypothetical protein
MIDDAQLGEKPQMINDAQILSDRLSSEREPPAEEAVVEERSVEQPESAVTTPDPEGDETPDPDEDDHEAQGRASAEAGEPRSTNPYDGRRAEGKAWFRGWDSVGARAEA